MVNNYSVWLSPFELGESVVHNRSAYFDTAGLFSWDTRYDIVLPAKNESFLRDRKKYAIFTKTLENDRKMPWKLQEFEKRFVSEVVAMLMVSASNKTSLSKSARSPRRRRCPSLLILSIGILETRLKTSFYENIVLENRKDFQ